MCVFLANYYFTFLDSEDSQEIELLTLLDIQLKLVPNTNRFQL